MIYNSRVFYVSFILNGCGGSPPESTDERARNFPPPARQEKRSEVCDGDWGAVMPGAGWQRSGIDRSACEASLRNFKAEMMDLGVGTQGVTEKCTCVASERPGATYFGLGEGRLGMAVTDAPWLVNVPFRDISSQSLIGYKSPAEDVEMIKPFLTDIGGMVVHPITATYLAKDGAIVMIEANFQKAECEEMTAAMKKVAGPPATTEEVQGVFGPVTEMRWVPADDRLFLITLYKNRGCKWQALLAAAGK